MELFAGGSGLGVESDLTTKKSEVDDKAYIICKMYHKGDQWIGTCMDTLKDLLFDNGISFHCGDEVLQITKEFKQRLDEDWIPWLYDVMDEIATRGIVPIHFVVEYVDDLPKISSRGGGDDSDNNPAAATRKARRTYRIVPQVPKCDHVIKTFVDPKTDRQVFEFHRLKNKKTGLPLSVSKHDKKVKVYSGFGYNPETDGSLRSLTSTLVKEQLYIDAMNNLSLKAEFANCNPPLWVETTEFFNGVGKDGGEASNTFDPLANKRNLVKEKAREEKAIMEIMKVQSSVYNEYFQKIHGKAVQYNPYTDNVRPLPAGTKIAHQLLPHARVDNLELNRVNSESICARYGVPKSIISDGGKQALTGAMTNVDTLVRTVLRWKKVLSRILTDVYRAIYEDTDRLSVLASMKTKDVINMTQDEAVRIKKGSSVTVSLTVIPNVTRADLMDMFIMGHIDEKTFKDYSLKLAGMPTDDITMNGNGGGPDEGGGVDKKKSSKSSAGKDNKLRAKLLMATKFAILNETMFSPPKVEGEESKEGGGAADKKKSKPKSKDKSKSSSSKSSDKVSKSKPKATPTTPTSTKNSPTAAAAEKKKDKSKSTEKSSSSTTEKSKTKSPEKKKTTDTKTKSKSKPKETEKKKRKKKKSSDPDYSSSSSDSDSSSSSSSSSDSSSSDSDSSSDEERKRKRKKKKAKQTKK